MKKTSLAIFLVLLVFGLLYVQNILALDGEDIIDDSTLIAFTSWRDGNAEIYTIQRDGENLTRLTNSEGDDYTPTWSPDGEWIAFTSMRDGEIEGSQEIYIMRADGSEQQNISNSPQYDAYPDWSPDGESIVFVSFRDGNTEIYSMNSDGTNQVNLTHHPSEDLCPSWSPNGEFIAFSSNRDGDFDIYVMTADGANIWRVTDFPTLDYCPVWSPFEDDILVYSAQWNDVSRTSQVTLDGSKPTQFKPLALGDGSPSWSRDLEWMAFTSNRDGNWEIYALDINGNEHRLTDNDERDVMPVVRPK